MATVAAANAADADAFIPQFLPEAKGFFVNSSLLSPFSEEDERALFEAGFKSDLQLSDIEVEVHGKMAATTAYFIGTFFLPGGSSIEGAWRYSETRLKKDGAWRILRYHFSASDVHGAQAVVARLHLTVSEGDIDTAVSCYAESYFRIIRPPGTAAGDPTGWSAGPMSTRDETPPRGRSRAVGWPRSFPSSIATSILPLCSSC